MEEAQDCSSGSLRLRSLSSRGAAGGRRRSSSPGASGTLGSTWCPSRRRRGHQSCAKWPRLDDPACAPVEEVCNGSSCSDERLKHGPVGEHLGRHVDEAATRPSNLRRPAQVSARAWRSSSSTARADVAATSGRTSRQQLRQHPGPLRADSGRRCPSTPLRDPARRTVTC